MAYDGFVVFVVIVYVVVAVVIVVGDGGGVVVVVVVVDVVVIVVGDGVGGGCRPVGDKENWCSLGLLTSFDFFKRDALSHNLCRRRLSTLAIGKMFSVIM